MSQIEDTQEEKQNWHWRNSMRTIRFFNLDARAALPIVLFLFHIRPYTLALVIVSTLIFYVLEQKGLSFGPALRALRVWLFGEKRPAWATFKRRRFIDYG